MGNAIRNDECRSVWRLRGDDSRSRWPVFGLRDIADRLSGRAFFADAMTNRPNPARLALAPNRRNKHDLHNPGGTETMEHIGRIAGPHGRGSLAMAMPFLVR